MNSPVHLTFCFRSVFDYFFSVGQTLELGLLSVQVSSQSQRIGVSFLKQQPFPGVQASDPLKDRHMAGARSFCQEINITEMVNSKQFHYFSSPVTSFLIQPSRLELSKVTQLPNFQ